MGRGYIQQPFKGNFTILGNSQNDNSIIDKVIDKITKLNASLNQSTNATVNTTNATMIPPTPQTNIPPQTPQQIRPPRNHQAAELSTIAGSPATTLNFDFSNPLTPLRASALSKFVLSSLSASKNVVTTQKQNFEGISDLEIAEIKRATHEAKAYESEIMQGKTAGAQSMKFKKFFKQNYNGSEDADDSAMKAWRYYKTLG